MKSKFINIFIKDKNFLNNIFLSVGLALLMFFLIRCDYRQGKLILELQQQKKLAARIPELEAKKNMLAARAGLSLTGIISGERPVAVINGQILVVGDEVAGRKILEIRKNSVLLDDGTQTVELELQ